MSSLTPTAALPSTSYDELDLSRVEDIERFLESTEDVYADAESYRAGAAAEQYRRLAFDDVKGEEIFDALYGIFSDLQSQIVSYSQSECSADTLSAGQIEQMQQQYDDLVQLRNLIQETYREVPHSIRAEEKEILETVAKPRVTEKHSTITRRDLRGQQRAEKTTVTHAAPQQNQSRVLADKPKVALVETTVRPQIIPRSESIDDLSDLRERASHLIRRITAGTASDSDVLRTARSLEHAFRQVQADPEKSDKLIRIAFAALESYTRLHESEWLRVCGVPVPQPGREGVATARLLRETLLVERDRHRALVQDPKKQMLVDKLIRKLSHIPTTGLSKEVDVPEVMALMRSIDVPDQQGELHVPICAPIETCDSIEPEPAIEVGGFGRHEPRHKVMQVSTDDTEHSLEISVANQTKERIAKRQVKNAMQKKIPPVTPVAAITKSDQKIVAEVEQKDPISILKPTRTTVVAADPIHERRSLLRLYLTDSVYHEFIAREYTSSAAFERMLDTTVTQIEAKTVDLLEKWLHEEHASPFSMIEPMTVGEVLKLAESTQVRQVLARQNIKYETFLTWVDLIPDMQSVVGQSNDMKFGALFARWMIESEMQNLEEQHHNSQVAKV